MFTDEQNIAFDSLIDFVDGDSPQFVLQGSAGTGKTYLMGHFAKCALEYNKICFVSTTHKACSELQKSLDAQGINSEVQTIHSVLSLKPKRDLNTGLLLFDASNRTYNTNYEEYDLYIIDEASMIDDQIYVLASQVLPKILWVGDMYQLPPINAANDTSLPFHKYVNGLIKGVALNTPVRYSGNILKYANALRDSINDRSLPNLVGSKLLGSDIKKLTYKKWMNGLLESQPSEKNINNLNKVRAIFYRNDKVNKCNQCVRDNLFGDEALVSYQPGEILMLKEPVFADVFNSIRNEHYSQQVFHSCEDIIIDDVDIATDEGLLYYFVRAFNSQGTTSEFSIIHELDEEKYLIRLNKLIQEAKREKNKADKHYRWDIVDRLKAKNVNATHTYAINANNAQGSSYESVFVNTSDILKCNNHKERNRRLYVAITRARLQLNVF